MWRLWLSAQFWLTVEVVARGCDTAVSVNENDQGATVPVILHTPIPSDRNVFLILSSLSCYQFLHFNTFFGKNVYLEKIYS